MGFAADADHVVTSAMAACDLGKQYIAEAEVERPLAYVIGHDSFKQLVADAGFALTDTADDHPHVVFHGHSPDNDWARLSEGALAIQRGARYFASNLDTTLPSERGFMVGNGSMVAAVTSATGVKPQSAGKPGPAMFEVAAHRIGSTKPLAVGDRLDTDIAGGNAAGMDTLCTVTGVSTHTDIIDAPSSTDRHISPVIYATTCPAGPRPWNRAAQPSAWRPVNWATWRSWLPKLWPSQRPWRGSLSTTHRSLR